MLYPVQPAEGIERSALYPNDRYSERSTERGSRMIDILQKLIQQAEQLEPAQQQAIAMQFQQVLDAFLQEEAAHPVFTDEV